MTLAFEITSELSEKSIEQEDNAFMIGKDSIKAKFGNQLHELNLTDRIIYSSPEADVQLELKSFEVLKNDSSSKKPVSLKNCATMYYLLKGITKSMPELPVNLKFEK